MEDAVSIAAGMNLAFLRHESMRPFAERLFRAESQREALVKALERAVACINAEDDDDDAVLAQAARALASVRT